MSDLELAQELNLAILGENKYALTCGCLLQVRARFPAPCTYMKLFSTDHDLCRDHVGDNPLRQATGMLPQWNWLYWYDVTPYSFTPITSQHFREMFDRCWKNVPPQVEIASNMCWILAQDGVSKIYSDGVVAGPGLHRGIAAIDG